MTRLKELPAELIVKIAGHVEHVADLMVQSIPWLITVDALSALERVAGNNAVAAKLRALRVGSKYIQLSREPRPETQLTTASANASNTAVRSLESVSRRLPQLELVEVTDGDALDHDVAKQFNLYPERRCPGMGRFERATGKTYNSKAGPYWSWDLLLREGRLPNIENGLGYKFELVLKALAAAQKLTKSLRVWYETRSHSLDHISVQLLNPLANLPPTTYSNLATSLAPLTTLSLMLCYFDPAQMSDPTVPVDDFIPSLLRLTPNLANLTL